MGCDMSDWSEYNPFGEQSQFRDGELRGMWQDRYRGQPGKIKQLRMNAAERRDEQ